MKSGVYKITNLKNNKFYIGSSVDVYRRKNEHISLLRRNVHANQYLQNAFNKYGEENFKFEIVELTNKDKILEREQYYIDLLRPYDKNIGYNILQVAGNCLGFNHSEETKERMSITRMGENNNFYGKTHNDEAIEKIRQANQGENSHEAILKENEILQIYELLAQNNLSIKIIAEKFGVKPNTITQIKNGDRWSHLYHLYKGNTKDRRSDLSEQDVLEIYKLLKQKVTQRKIAQQFKVSPTCITDIKQGRRWGNLYYHYLNE